MFGTFYLLYSVFKEDKGSEQHFSCPLKWFLWTTSVLFLFVVPIVWRVITEIKKDGSNTDMGLASSLIISTANTFHNDSHAYPL